MILISLNPDGSASHDDGTTFRAVRHIERREVICPRCYIFARPLGFTVKVKALAHDVRCQLCGAVHVRAPSQGSKTHYEWRKIGVLELMAEAVDARD